MSSPIMNNAYWQMASRFTLVADKLLPHILISPVIRTPACLNDIVVETELKMNIWICNSCLQTANECQFLKHVIFWYINQLSLDATIDRKLF